MGTNVYLTTAAPGPVDLAIGFGGPSSAFDPGYTLLQNQVHGDAQREKVMSIDRGGGFNPGMVQSTTELTLRWGGLYMGSLVVLLSNLQEPVKNSIDWSLRAPDESGLIDFTSDYSRHDLAFELPEATVKLAVQGVSTGWFDDIDLRLEVIPRHVVRLMTARDPATDETLALFVDDLGRTWRQDLDANGNWSTRRLVDSPVGQRTTDVAVAIHFEGGRSPIVVGVTDARTLWWRSASTTGDLPLGLASGTVASLAVSDVQGTAGDPHLDVIVATGGSSARLWRRVVVLATPPRFDGDWQDWGATAGRAPCFVPGTADRSVLAISPTTFGSLVVFRSTANAGSEWWSVWWRLPDLPNGVRPVYLTATPWFEDAKWPKQWGALVTASDGRIYLTTTDAPGQQPWDISDFAGTTIPATVGLGVGGGWAIALAVAGGTIRYTLVAVKENKTNWLDTNVRADGIRLLAPFKTKNGTYALAAGPTGLDLRSINLSSSEASDESPV